MFQQDGDILDEYRENVENVVRLLRFRLMEAVHDELNSFSDTVTKVLDAITAQGEGSLVTASYEDDMMESESDSDQEMDVTTVVIEQCEEIVTEEWESWSENCRVSIEPELSYEELEHFSSPESTESIVHKILINAAKIVINMSEDAGRDESTAFDDRVPQRDCSCSCSSAVTQTGLT